jgi:NADH-quinone oxidoreductase subunit J
VVSFFYFGTVIVLTAILVVALRNPVYSVLSLLIMFFHVAGLFIILHAEFLAAVQIVVYAGAILVLYLFVVMLLNVKRDDSYQRQLWVGIGLGALAIVEVITLLSTDGLQSPSPAGGIARIAPPIESPQPFPLGNTEMVGALLYTKYLFPFEIASLILLVAMIGAILLVKKGIMGPREQT